ncbi:hypothetical protein [Salinibacterium sp. SWN167]|uniref:hypothetical protein n=1 Tax=Salinibacterium sp. SWN167 TaxID=2792054 RepID=UPI0018CE3CE0|nr:hypothetical protein [Salinibacterium sp. SWN167]MBH0082356.1 hypothetical protein [Salinibacterium sp. SWN167]
MRPTTAIAMTALLFTVGGCATDSPPSAEQSTAAATAEASPSSSATPSPSDAADEEVSFSYRCYVEDESSGIRTELPMEFTSFEEVWEYRPAVVSCMEIKHGTVYTQAQLDAAEIAGPVLSSGIDQVGALYAQCAITDNGYLHLTALAPNQKTDVRAFLSLCPNRPGADHLRSLL